MIPATCGNCAAPLTGPFCSQCGQDSHGSARTLGALLHDLWHVLTHLDGRFWATLHLLLLRPGRLTAEYFADHRARYAPPVRLYLVLSVLLFALVSVSSHFKGDGAAAAAAVRDGATTAATDAATAAEAAGASMNFGLTAKDCDKVKSSWPWLEKNIRDSCRRNVGEGARAVIEAFKTNLPRMMFVFLPVMAGVMALLYWFPRRYYVEHLVFFLHNHAALFLVMILLLLTGLAARLLPALGYVVTAFGVATAPYALWYVYRSMRTYYGQGRALTLAKIALVSVAYVVCFMVTLLGNLILSVLTT